MTNPLDITQKWLPDLHIFFKLLKKSAHFLQLRLFFYLKDFFAVILFLVRQKIRLFFLKSRIF